MTKNDKKVSSPAKTVPTAGNLVKAKIIAAGVALGDLAEAAKVARPTLSNYLAGRLSNPETQFRIWRTFRRLSGSRITLLEFWGPTLLHKEVA